MNLSQFLFHAIKLICLQFAVHFGTFVGLILYYYRLAASGVCYLLQGAHFGANCFKIHQVLLHSIESVPISSAANKINLLTVAAHLFVDVALF